MAPDEAAELALIEVSRWQREAMTKPLTKEEHEARAMLIGGEYIEGINAYYVIPLVYLDADTMKPLTLAECERRIRTSDELQFRLMQGKEKEQWPRR